MEGDTVKKVVGGGWRLVALIHHQQHFQRVIPLTTERGGKLDLLSLTVCTESIKKKKQLSKFLVNFLLYVACGRMC